MLHKLVKHHLKRFLIISKYFWMSMSSNCSRAHKNFNTFLKNQWTTKFTQVHISQSNLNWHTCYIFQFSLKNECCNHIILPTLPHHLRWAFFDTFLILTYYQYFHNNKTSIGENQHTFFSAKVVTLTDCRSETASTFNPGT